MTENIQNTPKEGTFKRELTKEEKTARNRLYYLKFIEKCRNHEFLTVEERQADRTQCAAISPGEKRSHSDKKKINHQQIQIKTQGRMEHLHEKPNER